MPQLTDPEQACEQILNAVGHDSPPTDLEAVCSLWPDLSIAEEDLDKEGYLVPLGVNGAEVLIRRDDPPARKKFTLAHELGHWTQAHMKAGQVSLKKSESPHTSFQMNHTRQTPEETWCNRFAACLLMPKRDMISYLRDSEVANLATRISQGHTVFQVSQEAFLNRVTDTTPINVFEVVSTGAVVRIRRRYLSKHQRDNRVEQVITEVLDAFRDTQVAFNDIVSDVYEIQSHLTRSSQHSRSWLVSMISRTRRDTQSQG